MNRYTVTNVDGRIFEYEDVAPRPARPEWGIGYGEVVVNIDAEIAAKAAARAARKATIKAGNSATTLPQLKEVVKALIEHLGLEIDP